MLLHVLRIPFANLLLKFIATTDKLTAIMVSTMTPTTVDIAMVTGTLGLLVVVVLIGNTAMLLIDGSSVLVSCVVGMTVK